MKDKDKPKKDDMTHAQWVACWWSRTLGQITAQAAAGQETVSFPALVSMFLNINKIAIEDTCRTAWAYEAETWEDAEERCKRRDSTLDLEKLLVEADENRRAKGRAKVSSRIGRDNQYQRAGRPG